MSASRFCNKDIPVFKLHRLNLFSKGFIYSACRISVQLSHAAHIHRIIFRQILIQLLHLFDLLQGFSQLLIIRVRKQYIPVYGLSSSLDRECRKVDRIIPLVGGIFFLIIRLIVVHGIYQAFRYHADHIRIGDLHIGDLLIKVILRLDIHFQRSRIIRVRTSIIRNNLYI